MTTQTLNLRVLRSPETVPVTLLSLSGTGVLELGDAQILGAPLSEAEFATLSEARLRFGNDAAHPDQWWIGAHGNTWVCSINDRRVARDDKVWMQPDDRIEVGLMRLQVTAEGIEDSPQPAEASPVSLPEQENQHLQEVFDLEKLADRQSWLDYGGGNDPFAIIGGSSPYQEEMPKASELFAVTPDPTGPLAHATSGFPDNPTAQSDAHRDADIFETLAREYAKVIHDPDYLHRQHWGVEIPPETVSLTVPSPSEMASGWDDTMSLEDMVSGRLSIQHILERYNITDAQKLEITEPSDEVLSLFAQNVRSSSYTAPVIPELSRREHYVMGFDSPLDTRPAQSQSPMRGE